jgi:hypothetical protein
METSTDYYSFISTTMSNCTNRRLFLPNGGHTAKGAIRGRETSGICWGTRNT